MRLVLVELTRLRWRRAAMVLMGLGVLAPLAVFIGLLVTTNTQSLDDLVAEHGPVVRDEYNSCVEHPQRYGVPTDLSDADTAAGCESYVSQSWGNSRLDLVEQRESGTGPAIIVLITLVMLLAGTTFAGHDWNTGSMGNQLLFEPRRARVWAAKLAAVVLAGGGLALAVLVAYWTGLYAVASARDLPIPDHAMVAAYKQAVLGTIFVAGGAAFGYALTMLLRSTVGTLGLLFAAGFLGLVVVGALGIESAEQVMPWGNFIAYTVGGYTYYNYDICVGPGDGCNPAHVIERLHGTVYFLVVLVATGVPSFLSFLRRDVP
jgi:hypothetical protein